MKLIQGTARKDRSQEAVSLPKAELSTPAPSTLDAFGKAKWKELLSQYVDAGLMDKVDHMGLEQLCLAYQRGRSYRKDETRSEKQLRALEVQQKDAIFEKDFEKFKAISEMVTAANHRLQEARANQRRESQTIRQYLQEFGATPGSKRRLPPSKAEPVDPLLMILEGGQKKKA